MNDKTIEHEIQAKGANVAPRITLADNLEGAAQ